MNRREAEKFHALRISEVERGEYAKPAKITVSEFGRQYLEYAKANKRSWIRDQQIMNHLNEFFGTTMLSEVGPLAIEKYKLQRVQSVRAATVNREIALLKHLFSMAEQWGLYRGRNPVRGVRFLAEDNPQFRSLSQAGEEALLGSCSPYLQDLVVFAINTGLKNRRMLEVPLNDCAFVVVRAWWGMRKCEYVFYNPETGEQFKGLWLGLKKACRKAGVEDVTWHTFRHMFASRLTRAGVDLVTVKELLGHSAVSVTMRYAHTNREAKARAVELLGVPGDKVVTLPNPDQKKRVMTVFASAWEIRYFESTVRCESG